ncbi:hypothetical protein [Butyrivibrio fibrisolvens]|uniref:hypothetical protein n=1 Tax=Butyrivibrio fibrisolvens TaxID=831 RepID=UPI0003FA57D4|nr:hypothetical protein [Butyrivibrio fibrisolvens]
MNNRERVFCSVIKVIYDKYKEYGVFDFNSILFTYSELEEAFNSLHFGKEFRKGLFTNYYYGHGSKNEKIKFIVDGFAEESMEFYRLAYPNEQELYKEVLGISNQGWEYLKDYNQDQVLAFLKKYSSWMKKHKAEKNSIPGLSTNEAAWVSAVLLSYNTYFHDTAKCKLSDLFFPTSRITNLAYSLGGEYVKSTYSNAVRNRAVNHKGTEAFLSVCPDNRRRITFSREIKEYVPKIDDSIKLSTVHGKKSIKVIKKAIKEIFLFYYPTEEEYKALKESGLSENAHVCIKGNFVKRNKEALINYILKKYCAKPCLFDVFMSNYNSSLEDAGLTQDKSFLIDEAYKDILESRKDILCCGQSRFRYLPYKEKSAKAIISKLNLEKYRNKEISVSLIFNNNTEILSNTHLKNEYELFDFIKKNIDQNEYDVTFLDSNEICFGEANVRDQLLGIIGKFSPITKSDLILMYSFEYGSDKEFINSHLKSISDHFDGSKYWKDIPQNDNRSVGKSVISRSALAQLHEGEKIINRKQPEMKRIEYVLSKQLPENTAWGKLRNRLIREFIEAELVGEIELSDEEYMLLREKYFIPCCKKILESHESSNSTDILFTIAIVNVAIRKYSNGALWSYVAETIGVKSLTGMQQAKFGKRVFQTLMRYGKAYADENEYLRNILMHAFITDSFAVDFFQYLFQFYNLDLDRNISDTCEEEADYICNAIKNPYSKRQQMLSEYSGLSVYAAHDYCKGIIASSLKAIDNAFWGTSDEASKLPIRLYEKLIEWKNSEKGDFRKEKARKTEFKKYFNTPLLKCDTNGDVSFCIVLPKQLIQSSSEEERKISWRIKHDTEINEYKCRLSEGNFGLKTEELSVDIRSTDMFDKYSFELCDDQEIIKSFSWEEKSLCIFDKDGYFESLKSISEGEYIGFAPRGTVIESSAIEDSYDIPELTYFQFKFNTGDILSISGDENYYIGDVPQRGFSREGLLEAVSVYDGKNNVLPLYSKSPALIIDIEDEKVEGTSIAINYKKYRASDLRPIEIKNGRLLEQHFYFFDLTDVCDIQNGYNRVDIDIPGTSRGKSLEFIFMDEFNYGFEDAPYIYKTRGTLRINYQFEKKKIIDIKASDYEYMDFEFADLEENILKCPLRISGIDYTISFEVPLFLYSIDQIEWSYYRPDDFWHSDLPTMCYLKYPSKSIKLELTEDSGDIISFKYDKRTDGTFECDLTKIKSYIGPFHTKKMIHTIRLIEESSQYDLLRIINHSVFSNVELTADTDDNKIFANFDVLGKGDYYADIRHGNDLICEKVALDESKHLEIETQVITGEYEVILYESEVDEDSFDLDIQYQVVGKLVRKLRNPLDIAGERILLKSLQYVVNSKVVRSLSVSEKCINYIIIENKINKHSYEGTLIVVFHGTDIRDVKNVRITIPDFNRTNSVLVDFMDEYDEPDNLLYDSYSECVASPEYSNQCNKSERYRRFDPVLWTDDEESYYWNVEYTSRNAALERAAKEWNQTEHYKTYSDSIWKD